MPNVNRPGFECGERPPGFRSRRARIGCGLGAESIGASLFEVPPGEAACPHHVRFPLGEEGAHQLHSEGGTGADEQS